MSKPMRDADCLEHIQDAIAKVLRYTKGKGESDFLGDELIQDGVIRDLEIVGVTCLISSDHSFLENGFRFRG